MPGPVTVTETPRKPRVAARSRGCCSDPVMPRPVTVTEVPAEPVQVTRTQCYCVTLLPCGRLHHPNSEQFDRTAGPVGRKSLLSRHFSHNRQAPTAAPRAKALRHGTLRHSGHPTANTRTTTRMPIFAPITSNSKTGRADEQKAAYLSEGYFPKFYLPPNSRTCLQTN
jgi:hypothetical protein